MSHLLAWVTYLTSEGISFLICKMGLIIVLAHRVVTQLNELVILVKHSAQCLEYNKC